MGNLIITKTTTEKSKNDKNFSNNDSKEPIYDQMGNLIVTKKTTEKT